MKIFNSKIFVILALAVLIMDLRLMNDSLQKNLASDALAHRLSALLIQGNGQASSTSFASSDSTNSLSNALALSAGVATRQTGRIPTIPQNNTSTPEPSTSPALPVLIVRPTKSKDASLFIPSQSIPASMSSGKTYLISIVMKNTGNTTWTNEDGYSLAIVTRTGDSAFTWGVSRVRLAPNSVIYPGQPAVFTFTITAPTVAGAYPFRWQMLHGAAAFGDKTPDTRIKVK